jgi:hypothetical protein
MTNVHVFSNIWRGEINQNCFGLRLLFFLISNLNWSNNIVEGIDSAVNELILNGYVNEPISFVIRCISHLLHFNFFNSLIVFRNTLNDSGSHIHAGLETVASLLFMFVEDSHSTWRRVVPGDGWVFGFILFSAYLHNVY